jgi:hypothetical protein
MNPAPWNYEVRQAVARAALNRQVTTSLIASTLLVGMVVLAFVIGGVVQESRAAGHFAGASEASLATPPPARGGAISVQMPVF